MTKTILFIIFSLTISACSSTPNTEYYSLLAQTKDHQNISSNNTDQNNSIGIGPLVIPDMLNNFGIISIKNGNQLSLAIYDLWAGNLKNNITQVLADNISSQLDNERVWPFPWDNRNRPKLQVRIILERFMGELGGQVTLQAKWTLLDEYGRKELQTNKSAFSQATTSDSYADYVAALNRTLHQLSQEITLSISQYKP